MFIPSDVPAGTVVITNKAFNAFLKEQHDTVSECASMCVCLRERERKKEIASM